jgi:lysophospholipase L1-like esterase/dienelactone hydrolase
MKSLIQFAFAVLLTLAAGPLTSRANASGWFSLDGLPVATGNRVETNGLIRKFESSVLRVTRSSKDQTQGTILLLPGGGYKLLDVLNEGLHTAERLNSFGYDVAMLEYHVDSGSETRELALRDTLTAWQLIKSKSAALGLRTGRCGIMGYSAGGHLAARAVQTLATNSPDQQPDDLILIYPAYLNEIGTGSTTPLVRPPENPKPRLTAMMAEDDQPAWVKSCWHYVDAWQKSGGQANYHVFKGGGHGFGMKPELTGEIERWPDILQYHLENGTKPGMGPFNAVLPWFIGNRAERLAEFAQHAASDQGSIVFLGDSITAEWNLPDYFADLKVANRGIAGDTTRGMLCRLQSNVLDLQPKVIIILGGINDLFHPPHGTPEAIARNVRSMLEQIQAAKPKTTVLVCEILPSQFIAADLVCAANAAVAKVVAEAPNSRRVKTYEHFVTSAGIQNGSLFRDGTHLNSAGYAVWKKIMTRELARHPEVVKLSL